MTEQALKQIEEKHQSDDWDHAPYSRDILKLARALDFIGKALGMDALVQARRKAKRTLEEVAGD